MNATPAAVSAIWSLPRKLEVRSPAATMPAPTIRSLPEPHRNSAYGAVRNTNVVTRAFGSNPASLCANANAEVAAVIAATAGSGRVRRHSSTGRIASVTTTVTTGQSRSGRTNPSKTETAATAVSRAPSRGRGPSAPAARGRDQAAPILRGTVLMSVTP
ncbi:hypothetical protein GCM10009853_072450 [Glycomyces scopariae]